MLVFFLVIFACLVGYVIVRERLIFGNEDNGESVSRANQT